MKAAVNTRVSDSDRRRQRHGSEWCKRQSGLHLSPWRQQQPRHVRSTTRNGEIYYRV